MEKLIYILLFAPIVSFILGLFFKNHQEKQIYVVTISGLFINLGSILLLLLFLFIEEKSSLFIEGPILYGDGHSQIQFKFFVDGYSFVYLLTATIIMCLVTQFSRFYMHRETGYKRFFNNMIFFYLGLVIVVVAGNFESLFIGWEILGITSFFLIGFYRNRYLPVKNALKVVSLYRLADIALLITIWGIHHYWGGLDFNNLNKAPLHSLGEDDFFQYLIPILIVLAACVKSAQFPFSSWLPRAMEGPTTSTAIFYGSLSIHIGVFLLIRTAPLWEDNFYLKYSILLVGLFTFIITSLISSIQSTIKTQIGYASIAQIGLMFMEVGFGFYELAMIHFVSNAFFRSYQLLTSPSVLSYRIHQQIIHFETPKSPETTTWLDKIKLSIYILGIKEFNLDTFMYHYFWLPFKKIGILVSRIPNIISIGFLLSCFILVCVQIFNGGIIDVNYLPFFAVFLLILAIFIILRAFVERNSILLSWNLVVINQLFIALAVLIISEPSILEIFLFLSGIAFCGIIGNIIILGLNKKETISLNDFQGLIYEYPKSALIFILAGLGLAGFPITPTFVGEDLLLIHIESNQLYLVFLAGFSLIFDGIVVVRIYSRVFLGLHQKSYHEVANRAS